MIYTVKVCGRTFESRNLRQLLARAVAEKREMDRKLRFLPSIHSFNLTSGSAVSFAGSGLQSSGRAY